jgi:hypothetical protein
MEQQHWVSPMLFHETIHSYRQIQIAGEWNNTNQMEPLRKKERKKTVAHSMIDYALAHLAESL